MKQLFENLKNNFDFYLRNYITFSRKNYFEDNNLTNILINIYYYHIFKQYLSKNKSDNLTILDVGSKNWEYAKAQYFFFKSFNSNFTLNAIELDAYRLNSRFYNRYEIAKFYIKGLKNTNYFIGDFINHNLKYDYIIWILPFVSEYPLLKWGLPLKYFKPEKMLLHAYSLLKKDGELLIINQGEKEYLIQKKLNEKLNLNAFYFGEIENEFNIFKNKRYCSKIIKFI